MSPRATTRPFLAAAFVVVVAAATAQEQRSGPAVGTPLGALGVVRLRDDGPRVEFDLQPQFAHGPAAILFVHEMTRNAAPMIRGFDERCADLALTSLRSAVVLLAGDRTAAEQRVPVVSKALQMLSPILLSTDGAEGPGSYALNRKAQLTLVLAQDGVVVDSIGWFDTGAQDLDALQMHLAGLVGPVPTDDELERTLAQTLPTDRGEILALVARLERQRRLLLQQRHDLQQRPGMRDQPRMQPGGSDRPARGDGARGDAPAREAGAAARNPLQLVGDEQVAAALRRIVRKTADAAELDAAFTALDARLAAEPTLRESAQRAATALLRDETYGNDAARDRLRRWLERR